MRAFEDVGAVLLGALAEAADGDTALVRALTAQRAEETTEELAEVTEVLAALAVSGPAERRLAVRLLREVLRFTRDARG